MVPTVLYLGSVKLGVVCFLGGGDNDVGPKNEDIPSLKLTFLHLKMVVSKLGISFSRGLFSGAILVYS